MNSSEIRSRFLSAFGKKGHTVVPSSSLIPHDDPTLFFVNAGMVQFKDVFTGREQRAYRRATTVQKCLRVSGKHNDLENVGRTPRHHTFFEMLGNFSFGDYFKPEAIPMAWELLTGELGIDPNRLWITIYEDDDQAFDIWHGQVGVPAARIQRLGAKDNFWSMGDTGPCGPCSEIHYDHGPSISSETGGPATENPRYVEIWNLVFMQYEQTADGRRLDLPRPSIDTGAGLERIAAVLQGKYSNYDTDVFQGLIARTSALANVRYGADLETDTALRVIADHARATAFLIADGVMPSNEGRGYVLRRIMRRAIRFGLKIQLDKPFFHHVTDQVCAEFREAYPELQERTRFIDEVVQGEEGRFRSTVDRGMKLLEHELDRAGKGGTLSGDVAFTLSDTYGFPLDLTQLIAEENGVSVDEPGYHSALDQQRARGRAAWKGSGEQAVAELWFKLQHDLGNSSFTGYERSEDVGTIVGLVRNTVSVDGQPHAEAVQSLSAGESGVVLLDRTPFYAESGGQVGDTGTIGTGNGTFAVSDTTKAAGLHLHQGTLSAGTLNVGDSVHSTFDAQRRARIRRNHTATHLLHAALRNVLGDHVSQKGSLVGPNRLRFDFSHHKAILPAELVAIEAQVNQQILRNADLETSEQELEQAKAAGAMALFGEKYDSLVRVVQVPGYSVELCGGTHVGRTGDIGLLRIVSESGVAAGVRRIEAQTGEGALEWIHAQSDLLAKAAGQLKIAPDQLPEAIVRLQEERRSLEKEVEALKKDAAKRMAGDLLSQARDFHGIKVLAAEFNGDLREQADRLRDQLGSSLVVLGSRDQDKVTLLAAASKDIAGIRLHAGQVIGEIAPLVGGKGGGRPDMAQAGGREPAGLEKALERVYSFVTEKLNAS